MHGITLTSEGRTPQGTEAAAKLRKVRGIMLQYADGSRMEFHPEPRLDRLGESDLLELSKIFAKAAEKTEWAEHTNNTSPLD